jgi:hypothetical protein
MIDFLNSIIKQEHPQIKGNIEDAKKSHAIPKYANLG